MSEGKSTSPLLEEEVTKYRQAMAGYLHISLAIMEKTVSPVDLENAHRPIDSNEFAKDPIIPFRQMSNLLIAKARLHVVAALCANKSDNIHSFAVQMRPVLECAGQVVLIFKDLSSKDSGVEKRIGQYIESDYYRTAVRLSKGQIDHNHLLDEINTAYPMRKEPLRKVEVFKESQKVKELEFGHSWYGHLSTCFYHSDIPKLKGISYCGGVSSCNTFFDEYAFAALMDYLTHQILVMLMFSALYPVKHIDDEEDFEKIAEVLQKKKAVANRYRDNLQSMVVRSNEVSNDYSESVK